MKKTLKVIGILTMIPMVLLTLTVIVSMLVNPYQYQINHHNSDW